MRTRIQHATFLLVVVLAFLISAVDAAIAQPIGYVRQRVLVKFHRGTPESQAQSALAQLGVREQARVARIGVRVLSLPSGKRVEDVVRWLRNRRDVEFAEPDWILPPANTVPNDPQFPNQWHLSKIAAPAAWDSVVGSPAVVIAILDTGCDPNHPDLAPKYVPGWNFYDNNSNWSDVHGHGTAVAGCAAAVTNNAQGVAGVAWDCRIMPIRISDPNGYASLSTITSALVWAADQGARVANISYRVSEYSSLQSAAQYFVSKGGVVTVSAGNQATFISDPDNPYVLTVGATTSSDTLASFSNTGNIVDMVAPGSNITTTQRGGGYATWSGTSFSAPITAGVAALVIAAQPGLSGRQVMQVLIESCDDLGATGWDPAYGWGRLNAQKAVARALSGVIAGDTTPPSVQFASPAAGATVSDTVLVSVNATDNVAVDSVAISLNGVTVANLTKAPYTWSWNTTNYANGAYNLTAVATDTSGNQAAQTITVNVYNIPDTTPPSISIVSPVSGSVVSGSVNVQVLASDNKAVTKVELYVNGKRVASSTTPPFSMTWNTRGLKAATYTLQCRAYDAAGNSTWSNSVKVTVTK
jgi:subtilisin family serine protease